MSDIDRGLEAILERARALGYLGPGPVVAHLAHAEAFATVVEQALGGRPDRFVDLGTGGGVPGLVLARRWPASHGVFLDSNRRRCATLRDALGDLGWSDRVEVLEGRAEAAAHLPRLRETFDAATARAFASPPVVAEIAAGFVAPGGVAVVSEPPAPDPDRWPPDRLADVGFAPARPATVQDLHFMVLTKEQPVAERYPRGVGKPGKRPLW